MGALQGLMNFYFVECQVQGVGCGASDIGSIWSGGFGSNAWGLRGMRSSGLAGFRVSVGHRP